MVTVQQRGAHAFGNPRWSTLLLVGCAITLAGCNYHKLRDPEPTTPVPTRFTQSEGIDPSADGKPTDNAASTEGDTTSTGKTRPPEKAQPPRDARWWRALNDTQLSALIEEALNDNLTLQTGWARVRQAKHLARQARAARFPQIGAQGDFSLGNTLQPGFGKIDVQSLSGSLPVTYEVDLFARRARAHQAGKLQHEASEFDQQALAMTISAEVADAWFNVVNARLRRALLASQLQTETQFFELVELRYREGLNEIVDVHQQGQRVAQARGLLSAGVAQEQLSAHTLAVLLGDLPGRPFALDAAALPDLSPIGKVDTPASVIAQRPDVLAASRRVEQADRSVAAAVGARLPRVTLAFTPQYSQLKAKTTVVPDPTMPNQTVTNDSTTSGFTWNLGAQLSVPIFDGRLGKAQIDTERAVLDQALNAYEQSILTALVEVENALVLERQQREGIGFLQDQTERANAALESTQQRYRQGLTDFLPVFTALANKQGAELALLDAKRQLVAYRVQLYRALGGVWPDEFKEPEEP